MKKPQKPYAEYVIDRERELQIKEIAISICPGLLASYGPDIDANPEIVALQAYAIAVAMQRTHEQRLIALKDSATYL